MQYLSFITWAHQTSSLQHSSEFEQRRDPRWQLCLRGGRTRRKDVRPSVVREGQSYPAVKEASQSSGVVSTSACVQKGRGSQRTPLNAVKISMGYYLDAFRDAHGCMQSLSVNNEYGTWPRFVKQSLDAHFCNKDLNKWLIRVLLMDSQTGTLSSKDMADSLEDDFVEGKCYWYSLTIQRFCDAVLQLWFYFSGALYRPPVLETAEARELPYMDSCPQYCSECGFPSVAPTIRKGYVCLWVHWHGNRKPPSVVKTHL